MAFKTFDRAIYAKIESTEGSSISPGDSNTSYIETVDPTYTVNRMGFDRNPTRKSITDVPQEVCGTSVTVTGSTVEFSFGVELTGSGTAGTAPAWSPLLVACGFNEIAVSWADIDPTPAGTTAAPHLFHDRESLSSHASYTTYNTLDCIGRCVSDTFAGVSGQNRKLFFNITGGDGTGAVDTVTTSDLICGEVGGGEPRFTAASGQTNAGVAWVLIGRDSKKELGGGNTGSLTIRLVTDLTTGAYIEGTGCRGNVEFVFEAGNLVMMNYTFTGRLGDITDVGADNDAPVAATMTTPPAMRGVSFDIQDSSFDSNSALEYDSSIFSTMSINMGNEITARTATTPTSGYKPAYITGRAPTMTFNPDAVTETNFAFWDQFLSGDVTRGELKVGSAVATGRFLFRMPAMQFSGIADGNRDEVFVYDSTTNLTGGDYGSSIIVEHTSVSANSTQLSERMGTNNEFFLFHY